MKRIRKSRAARILSWLMSVIMVTPLFCSLFVPSAAKAQAAAPAAGQSVIVMDFTNKSGVPGNLVTNFAASEVANELASSGRFDPLSSNQVAAQIRELQLTPPYDTDALTKLAAALGAADVVTGEITAIKIDTKHQPRTVQVWLRVNMLEANSGDLVNGAAQIGTATAAPGRSDDDTLIREATTKAASLAVRQMLATNLPAGTVLSTGGPEDNLTILINRGSRDGIHTGDEMVVLRDRQRVARLRVTRVFPDDSECRVLQNNLGIRPEDRVRVVFPVPDFPTVAGGQAPSRTSSRNSIRSLTQILLVLGVIALVVATVGNGKNSTVTGLVAEATMLNNAPAVRVVWNNNLFGGNTIEYHIWRRPDDPFTAGSTPVALTTGDQQYVDQPAPFTFWTTGITYLKPPTDPTSDALATATAPAVNVPGFITGRSYTYQVTAVIRLPTGPPGNQTGNPSDIESSPQGSGQVTPINQSVQLTPTQSAVGVNLANVVFTFGSVVGADEFQVIVSTDPAFPRNKTVPVATVISTAPFAAGVQQTTPAISLSNTNAPFVRTLMNADPAFRAFVTGQSSTPVPLYWRVGARNRSDSPGPVHLYSQNPHDPDRTFRYVYSGGFQFTPAQLPPPPP